MYLVKNIALTKELVPFKVAKLEDLTDDQMLKFCLDNRIEYARKPVTDKNLGTVTKLGEFLRNDFIQRIGKSEKRKYIGTLNRILQHYTINFYMEDSYWLERHLKRAEEIGFYDEIELATNGLEVFRAYESLGVGVAGFLPGEEIELDLTDYWVAEVFNRQAKSFVKTGKKDSLGVEIKEEVERYTFPKREYIELIDLDKPEEKVVEPKDIELTNNPYKDLHWKKLEKIAKDKGLVTEGVKKTELADIIYLNELKNGK